MSTKKIQLLVLLLAMTATGWAHSKLPPGVRSSQGEDFIPTPRVARQMAFGFEALLSDYYWLQAIQVVGGVDVVGAKESRELGQLVDVVTTLNPHVGHPYRFAAVWLTHDKEQVREGIRLLHRAIENHPDDWRNYFYAGFNHFFYLGEYGQAAQILEAAIALPGRPAYLPRLVARLKSQHGDIDVAEVFLLELYKNSRDEEAKATLRGALDEIEIEYRARHLDRARAAYRELSGRDITSVEDLTRGPHPILEQLPSAEPSGIPAALSRGSRWEIDPESNRILSTYLGRRYDVQYSPFDRKRLEAWSRDSDSADRMNSKESNGNG